jgi:hypothetical protein
MPFASWHHAGHAVFVIALAPGVLIGLRKVRPLPVEPRKFGCNTAKPFAARTCTVPLKVFSEVRSDRRGFKRTDLAPAG